MIYNVFGGTLNLAVSIYVALNLSGPISLHCSLAAVFGPNLVHV